MTIKKFIIISLIFSAPFIANAQEDPPGPPPDAEEIPLDGGISLLIGAGVLLRVGTLKKRFKKID